MDDGERPTMSVPEATARLRVSRRTVQGWMERGGPLEFERVDPDNPRSWRRPYVDSVEALVRARAVDAEARRVAASSPEGRRTGHRPRHAR